MLSSLCPEKLGHFYFFCLSPKCRPACGLFSSV